jgi:hypothetical protein
MYLTSCENQSMLLADSACGKHNIISADLIRFWFCPSLSLPFHSPFLQPNSWKFSFLIFSSFHQFCFTPLYCLPWTEKIILHPQSKMKPSVIIYILMVFVISWLMVRKRTDWQPIWSTSCYWMAGNPPRSSVHDQYLVSQKIFSFSGNISYFFSVQLSNFQIQMLM